MKKTGIMKEQHLALDLTTGEYAVINHERASSFDGVIFHPGVSGVNARWEVIQLKFSDQIKEGRIPSEFLTYDLIDIELKKINNPKHKNFYQGKPFTLVIITNKPLKNFEQYKQGSYTLPDGVIVICYQNFKEVFPEVFITPSIWFEKSPYTYDPNIQPCYCGKDSKCMTMNCSCFARNIHCDWRCHYFFYSEKEENKPEKIDLDYSICKNKKIVHTIEIEDNTPLKKIKTKIKTDEEM